MFELNAMRLRGSVACPTHLTRSWQFKISRYSLPSTCAKTYVVRIFSRLSAGTDNSPASNQYIFDEFLAFLKRLPNLKKLDLAYFVLAASQIPHSIESMSERKLARHVPCLVSLLQRLIDTSLLEVYAHASYRVSGAARWQRNDLSVPFERQAWS